MAENFKIVFTKPCPIEPIEVSDKEAYKAWIKFDEIARYYILTLMNNVLQ